MCKLSLIIPCYNVEKYLPECLDSLDRQKCRDFEVILTDDGSTDQSGKLCDSYAALHPDYVRVIHQENRGLGGARNAALPIASGEYIFFIDSDDTITDDAVEKIIAAVDETDADIVIFPLNIVAESDGSIIQIQKDTLPTGKVLDPATEKACICGFPVACNKVARKSLYTDNCIVFPERAWYEDIRTTPKLIAAAQKVLYLDTPLYNYLRREGSIMNNAKIERNREIIDALDDLYSYFDAHSLSDKYREELEYLTVDHVLVSASVRVIRAAGKHPLLAEFSDYAKKKCGNINANSYVCCMPKNRKLILRLLLSGHYAMIRLIFKIKG